MIAKATPSSVWSALRKMGHTSFRPGQEEAVMRVLSGISTLVTTATGSGKSLCYQLPAFLYQQTQVPCITLVISPLLSLMDDQVKHLPVGLKGACLHTNQTYLQREKVLRDVAEGHVSVLLLSPEALVGGTLWKRGGGAYSLHDLPPVAFACIDEAHCISEWSHSFRPSYLRLCKILRERLRVQCVLGLTATATYSTGISIARHLGVAEGNIIRGSVLPDNLHITVSCDQDRNEALLELLRKDPFKNMDSIIIYCTQQQTTESVAQMLRTRLQPWNQTEKENGGTEFTCEMEDISKPTGKRKRVSTQKGKRNRRQKVLFSAESYHAGMSASQRRSVQNKFMSGSLRIVVATIAFGMGLNKSNVRAVIHYNMPKCLESFVQEVGRAGRDGEPAFCHVFIDREGNDLYQLRRHAYSNSIDPYVIKKLVEKSFPVCRCKEAKPAKQITNTQSGKTISSKLQNPRCCGGHEVAFPIEATVQSLDANEECLETLLCYLELEGWLEVKNHVNDSATLKCYGGPRQLRALARKVPAVAAAAARLKEKGVDLDNACHLTFSVIELANSMGWESQVLRSELVGLQFNDRGTCHMHKGIHSTILVEMDKLSFHLVAPGDLTSDEREYLIQLLREKVNKQEKRAVEKLHILHAILKAAANRTSDSHGRTQMSSHERVGEGFSLEGIIKQYFSVEELSPLDLTGQGIPVMPTSLELSHDQEEEASHDVTLLVTRYSDQQFTGRAIARIFHGISSPKFPAVVWGSQGGFWRKHMDLDFNKLCNIATRKLLELRE